jgi:hypothetical protein
MQRIQVLLLLLALSVPAATRATADVLPPRAAEAAERLRRNPDAFDRTDQFCKGRRRGDACEIAASPLAGGGGGTCRSAIDRAGSTIDLSCERADGYVLDRGLPEGGFVADASLCAGTAGQPPAGAPYACRPLQPMPVDRFCAGRPVGAACSAEISRDGARETHPGVCRTVEEQRGFYFQGRRVATREVVRCEATSSFERVYTPVGWWEKLFQ